MADLIVTLDEATHVYTDQAGRQVPNVTTILQEEGYTGSYYPPGAAERGREVHRLIAATNNGLEPEVPEALRGYVDSYLGWRDDAGFVPSLVEAVVVHQLYRFCGTMDVEGLLGVDPAAIVDLKSGRMEAWHALQTAGYGLARTNRVSRDLGRSRHSLYLDKGGARAKLVTWDDPQDVDVFLAALTANRWKWWKGVYHG